MLCPGQYAAGLLLGFSVFFFLKKERERERERERGFLVAYNCWVRMFYSLRSVVYMCSGESSRLAR